MAEMLRPELAEMLLRQDEEQNRYVLLRLRQGGVGKCWRSGNSVCLWDAQHNKYFYVVQAAEEMQDLFGTVRNCGEAQVSLVTNTRWLPVVQAMEDGLQVNLCTQLRAVPFSGLPPVVPGIRFGNITSEVAQWIVSVYEHPELSEDFILRRVAQAPSVAAFYEDKPVGFFITHSDAELGPVYIDPAFRGSGLASAVYAEMLRLYSQQELPILFVFPGNHASQKWLRRLGCIPAPQTVAWFWRE